MTNINTIDKTLTDHVSHLFSDINALKQEKKEKTAPLSATIATIEKQFNSKICLLEQEIDTIKEQYSSLAHDIAIESGNCPYSRWGNYLEPNEVNINEKGIELTWIQSNNYGSDHYDYFCATWDNLLEHEQQQLLDNVIEDID